MLLTCKDLLLPFPFEIAKGEKIFGLWSVGWTKEAKHRFRLYEELFVYVLWMIRHPVALDSMLLPCVVLCSDLNVTAVSCLMALNLQLKGSNSGVKFGRQNKVSDSHLTLWICCMFLISAVVLIHI